MKDCLSHQADMNNTTVYGLEPVPAVYAVVYGCILALGLPLNAVSLWIFLRRHSLKSTSTVFMVNLASSDLLLVISLPMRVYFYATGAWPFNDMVCNWITMLFRNNIRSSSIFITVISIDRLLAVVYPLRSRHLRTPSNAWKAAALVWLFVFVVNIPESIALSKHLKKISQPICFELYNGGKIYEMAYLLAVLVFIMLAVNVVCTAMVFRTLRSRLKDSAKVINKVNVMLIFVMNLVMFTICFVPVSVGMLHKETDIRPLTCLATANCCLDPLLYYFSLDAFWKKKEEPDLEPSD